MALIVAFILRAVAIEFSYHNQDRARKWSGLLSAGSFFATFIGLYAIGLTLSGLPLGRQGIASARFFDYLSWFPFIMGCAGTLAVVWARTYLCIVEGTVSTTRKNCTKVVDTSRHHPREKSSGMESSAPKDGGATIVIASAGYCGDHHDSGNSYLFANYLSHFPKPTERKTHLN